MTAAFADFEPRAEAGDTDCISRPPKHLRRALELFREPRPQDSAYEFAVSHGLKGWLSLSDEISVIADARRIVLASGDRRIELCRVPFDLALHNQGRDDRHLWGRLPDDVKELVKATSGKLGIDQSTFKVLCIERTLRNALSLPEFMRQRMHEEVIAFRAAIQKTAEELAAIAVDVPEAEVSNEIYDDY